MLTDTRRSWRCMAVAVLGVLTTVVPRLHAGTPNLTASDAPLEVKIVSVKEFAQDPRLEQVTAAAGVPGGGLLAATNIRGGSSFVYKISNTADVVWRKQLTAPRGTTVNSIGVATDGSYWAAGSLTQWSDVTGRPQLSGVADFAEEIAVDGTMPPPVALTPLNQGQFFHCAFKSGPDFVQISGHQTLEGQLRLQVPAVSKIDGTGARRWEQFTPVDADRRIELSPQDMLKCAGIFATQDKKIIAAARILVFPSGESPEEALKETAHGLHLRPGTLLISLDSAGREIGRIRHDDTRGALLVATNVGVSLLETSYKTPGALNNTSPDGLVHIYSFDTQLQARKQPIVLPDSALDSVEAAYVTPEGGFLLTGCAGSGGGYLRYVTPQGVVSRKQPFSELGYCGGTYQFGPGHQSGEALLLEQTPNLGNQLLVVHYRR